jgi:hypothetical protein
MSICQLLTNIFRLVGSEALGVEEATLERQLSLDVLGIVGACLMHGKGPANVCTDYNIDSRFAALLDAPGPGV